MCVYNIKKNFIFLHIAKAGGTSVYFATQSQSLKSHHLSYIQARDEMAKMGMSEFFAQAPKFTVVRDPLARMKSLFAYLNTYPFHELCQYFDHTNFDEFAAWIAYSTNPGAMSMTKHLSDENGIVPEIKIFRFERREEFNDGVVKLCKLKEPIPHANKAIYPIGKISPESCWDLIRHFEDDYKNFYPEVHKELFK